MKRKTEELDDAAQAISPSIGVGFRNLPAVEQLVREADEHLIQAEDHYRRALEAEAAGNPHSVHFFKALVEQGAASLCQQRAQLVVLSLALHDVELEEDEDEPGGQVS